MSRETLGAMTAAVAIVVLGVGLAGCTPGPLHDPGEDRCPEAKLPDGAVVRYESGGHSAGEAVRSFVAFSDGTLIVNERVRVTFPRARIAKLVTDLEATGVKDVDEGCYWPEPIEWDAGGATLEMRDGASALIWSHSASGDAPRELFDAFSVGDALKREIERSGQLPEG